MTEDRDNDVGRVIAEAEFVLAIVGDVTTGEFKLVHPSKAAPIESLLGVVAIVKGQHDAAFLCGVPEPMLDRIRDEFNRRIEAGFRMVERVMNMPMN